MESGNNNYVGKSLSFQKQIRETLESLKWNPNIILKIIITLLKFQDVIFYT